MSELEKVLDALSSDERDVIDRYASEYMEDVKDSAFRKAWMDLRIADDSDQRKFMDSDEFAECLHQYQTDNSYWYALHRRNIEVNSAADEAGYMQKYDKVA